MRGRPFPPRKAPGKCPKLDQHARRLLDADLEERPAVTLSKRREFLGRVCGGGQQVDGLSAAPSNGVDPKRALGASERDEWLRAAWRRWLPNARRPQRPAFVDGCGAHASLAPLYAWSHHGERA